MVTAKKGDKAMNTKALFITPTQKEHYDFMLILDNSNVYGFVEGWEGALTVSTVAERQLDDDSTLNLFAITPKQVYILLINNSDKRIKQVWEVDNWNVSDGNILDDVGIYSKGDAVSLMYEPKGQIELF